MTTVEQLDGKTREEMATLAPSVGEKGALEDSMSSKESSESGGGGILGSSQGRAESLTFKILPW